MFEQPVEIVRKGAELLPSLHALVIPLPPWPPSGPLPPPEPPNDLVCGPSFPRTASSAQQQRDWPWSRACSSSGGHAPCPRPRGGLLSCLCRSPSRARSPWSSVRSRRCSAGSPAWQQGAPRPCSASCCRPRRGASSWTASCWAHTYARCARARALTVQHARAGGRRGSCLTAFEQNNTNSEVHARVVDPST